MLVVKVIECVLSDDEAEGRVVPGAGGGVTLADETLMVPPPLPSKVAIPSATELSVETVEPETDIKFESNPKLEITHKSVPVNPNSPFNFGATAPNALACKIPKMEEAVTSIFIFIGLPLLTSTPLS
jgi:hypothetical protein